ncbi:predicted protein [Nematostella vectensis]|uniref:VPS10 domain-containing protein n=1 Tax=Nematostella vectensis TaxID=45351 RepID=A7S315_NEMVE|nr:predicted protein [Nematostella vectensis]|eukprot:XP_001633942.1 predicted protein [Nematostella vectensis]
MDVLPRQFAGLAIFLVFVSVNSYRFSIPTNLFTQGPVDSSLEPEGLREIRALSLDEETDEHDEERKLHQRFRRASVQPSEPIIIEVNGILNHEGTLGFWIIVKIAYLLTYSVFSYFQSDLKGETRNIFYMYWPGNAAQDKNILLLAKNEQGPPKPIIYLSTNFGKNWTNINSRLQLKNRRSQGSVDQIYVSKLNPRLCLLADATNKHLFLARDFQNFVAIQLSWTPSFLSFHPTKAEIIAGYDKLTKKLYLSRDQGVSFTEIQDSLKAFWWGVPDVDEYSIMFFEVYKSQAKDSQSTAYKYDFLTVNRIKLLDYVDEFEVMQKYCFATLTKTEGDKKSTEFLVSYKRGNFKPTKFPVKEHSRMLADRSTLCPWREYFITTRTLMSPPLGLAFMFAAYELVIRKRLSDLAFRESPVYSLCTGSCYGSGYSTNGGNNWTSIPFTSPQNKVLVEDIMTQAEEKLPIFILYGSTIKDNKKQWKLFHINLTSVLGSPCQASDMQLWVPSDDRAGLERCILGEQVEYKIRNWTKTCLMGKDYEAGKVVKSCTCRRVDFECPQNKVLVEDIMTQAEEKLPIFILYGSTIKDNKKQWKLFHINLTSVLDPEKIVHIAEENGAKIGEPTQASIDVQLMLDAMRQGFERISKTLVSSSSDTANAISEAFDSLEGEPEVGYEDESYHGTENHEGENPPSKKRCTESATHDESSQAEKSPDFDSLLEKKTPASNEGERDVLKELKKRPPKGGNKS